MEDISNTVTVFVGGDGGCWSCEPAVLYKIPTDIFDYNMMIGALCTQEDLEAMMDTLRRENIKRPLDEYTDIWVNYDKTWSGLPSVKYEIPIDVFDHLQRIGNTEKTIGNISCNQDLERLIERCRNGAIDLIPEEIIRTRPKNTEVKKCGHICTASSVKDGCCACFDIRPIQMEGTYPCYSDGVGWTNSATRSYGYCPYCQFNQNE